MLRLLDALTGSHTEVRPARAGVLRICTQPPQVAARSSLTALRVLLVADLLARTAELGGLQVLTALAVDDLSAGQVRALERDADALGIHPPTARTTTGDATSSLGGPIDVYLVSASVDPVHNLDGPSVGVGAAHLEGAGGRAEFAAGGLPARSGWGPLAIRLGLMSFPGHFPADLTGDGLDIAGETLASWRRHVARWAESPSQPMPARAAETARAAFSDLDTVSTLGLLRAVAQDASMPAGAKFETFVYADRFLGLDLARDIGR